jgi:hypothetical protein
LRYHHFPEEQFADRVKNAISHLRLLEEGVF